jgi:hypothetical protein
MKLKKSMNEATIDIMFNKALFFSLLCEKRAALFAEPLSKSTIAACRKGHRLLLS